MVGDDAVPLRTLREALRPAANATAGNGGLPGAAGGHACEMCAEPVPEENHSHVVNLDSRELMCTCRPCALLFSSEAASHGHYRAVGDRYLSFPDFHMDARQWDELGIPVGMVFFFHNSRMDETVAFYPSPAGATQSELSMRAWRDIVAQNPGLDMVTPDVEAILVATPDAAGQSPGPVTPEGEIAGGERETAGFVCYLVPIDVCYELVGTLRSGWRGFDGGSEVRHALGAFFDRLARRSRPAGRQGGT